MGQSNVGKGMQQIVFAVGLFSWFLLQFFNSIIFFLRGLFHAFHRHIFPSCFLIPLRSQPMSYAQSQGSKEVDEDVSSDAALIPPVDESALTRRFCSLKISLVWIDWLYFARNIFVDSFQREYLINSVLHNNKTFRPRLSPQGVTECTLSLKAVRPAGTCLSGTSSFVMLSERTLLRGKINNNASLYIILYSIVYFDDSFVVVSIDVALTHYIYRRCYLGSTGPSPRPIRFRKMLGLENPGI